MAVIATPRGVIGTRRTELVALVCTDCSAELNVTTSADACGTALVRAVARAHAASGCVRSLSLAGR